jgi:hypothetical protein
MYTKAFLYQKVRFSLDCTFVTLPLITWFKRVFDDRECMVRQLAFHLNPYLRCFRAILHDPKTYPDPEEFKPERFLNEDGSVRDDPALSLAFGVGKRICPGRHLVDSTVFIVTCSVLSVFNVAKAKDDNGNEIPVKIGVADPRRFLA